MREIEYKFDGTDVDDDEFARWVAPLSEKMRRLQGYDVYLRSPHDQVVRVRVDGGSPHPEVTVKQRVNPDTTVDRHEVNLKTTGTIGEALALFRLLGFEEEFRIRKSYLIADSGSLGVQVVLYRAWSSSDQGVVRNFKLLELEAPAGLDVGRALVRLNYAEEAMRLGVRGVGKRIDRSLYEMFREP